MKNARLQLIITMMLFGTIGTLSRFINMPSSIICMGRAATGVITILIILFLRKQKLDFGAIKTNAKWLAMTSCCMCANWIFQFEAFKYTTIATSTLCYYMQPIFFIILAAIILKERISPKKGACVLVAFGGMIFVSGVLQVGLKISELKGVLFGIAGGFFYAVVVLINKYMKDISTFDTTIVQLSLVSVIMLPYSLLTGAFSEVSASFTVGSSGSDSNNVLIIAIISLLVLGVLHTGIAYVVYFDCINRLSAQTAGILSYIDPVEAVLLSAFFLREPINVYTIIGAIMILGATAVSELGSKESSK